MHLHSFTFENILIVEHASSIDLLRLWFERDIADKDECIISWNGRALSEIHNNQRSLEPSTVVIHSQKLETFTIDRFSIGIDFVHVNIPSRHITMTGSNMRIWSGQTKELSFQYENRTLSLSTFTNQSSYIPFSHIYRPDYRVGLRCYRLLICVLIYLNH